ncbi:MAG: hypothetical protein OJF59_000927 [Cytophagales bacterium]|jgi:FkbM family methyltransferase|nr:FkbM family methyltransferase [Bacteroidota bacterium]MBS1980076.1 FkbM family methyltransferase [Bacteroidota bacterium]WHZ07174.1 MAG: hypothetical protein OJF59_000927 [Cytophagales bacterium]
MTQGLTFKVKLFNLFRQTFKIKWIEQYLAKLTAGKNPNHFFSKLVPNHYQYQHGSFRNIFRDGIRMNVDISDYVGHYYYFGFKDKSIERLFSLCHENFSVIDVGTNWGWTLLKFSSLAKNGTVLGFEPDPVNFNHCKKNVMLNQANNIHLFPVGLGDLNTTLKIEVRTVTNRGGNRIAVNPNQNGADVEIIRLDDFTPATKLSHINLIKIDVEGYEHHVLKGAKEILRQHMPVLFIELDNNNLRDQGSSAVSLIQFLIDIGYRHIVNAETEESITLQTNFDNCHLDIIAK